MFSNVRKKPQWKKKIQKNPKLNLSTIIFQRASCSEELLISAVTNYFKYTKQVGKICFYLLGKMHTKKNVVLLASILHYIRQKLFKISTLNRSLIITLPSEFDSEYKHKDIVQRRFARRSSQKSKAICN